MPTTTTELAVKDFVSALASATQDPIRLIVGDDNVEIIDNLDPILAQAGRAPIYLSPVTSTGVVPFLYSFTENAQPDQWQDDVLKPTAVLFKDGALICAYALDVAAEHGSQGRRLHHPLLAWFVQIQGSRPLGLPE